MTYSVKEIYFTLQGEGARTGDAAVFLRFAGCNLWSGRERDRAMAVCRFCDTRFVGTDGAGGGKFRTAKALAAAVEACWRPVVANASPYVVCTGGEPLLQLDRPAISALQEKGFQVGVETNGTVPAPPGLDWICVSPKANAPVRQREGDELKLVYPQVEPDAQPERFARLDFAHRFLQPLDNRFKTENTRAVADYCRKHPEWRISRQTHKIIGIA